jgi:hypothetical protein
MTKMKTKEYVKNAIVGLGALALLSGCSSYGKVIKNEPVSSIPDKKYEKIIMLKLPEGEPIDPNAGFIYVEPKGKISTDYPREELVKNLDGLQKNEQLSRTYRMGKFIIKDSKSKVRGYYEMLPEYTAVIWERKDDILLQVIIPNSMDGNNNGTGAGCGGKAGGKSGGK